jgi:hypothetical protein
MPVKVPASDCEPMFETKHERDIPTCFNGQADQASYNSIRPAYSSSSSRKLLMDRGENS